jgi:hypothetical protein
LKQPCLLFQVPSSPPLPLPLFLQLLVGWIPIVFMAKKWQQGAKEKTHNHHTKYTQITHKTYTNIPKVLEKFSVWGKSKILQEIQKKRTLPEEIFIK